MVAIAHVCIEKIFGVLTPKCFRGCLLKGIMICFSFKRFFFSFSTAKMNYFYHNLKLFKQKRPLRSLPHKCAVIATVVQTWCELEVLVSTPLEIVKVSWTKCKATYAVFWWTQLKMGQGILSSFKRSNDKKLMMKTSVHYSRQVYSVSNQCSEPGCEWSSLWRIDILQSGSFQTLPHPSRYS